MPLIRCPQCGQAYDIPPAVAVKLPTSVANCECGFWLCGNREGLMKRMSETGRIDEIDVTEFRTDVVIGEAASRVELSNDPLPPSIPKNVHVVARGADESIDTIFTLFEHPLWIGRRGCHIEFDDAELSIQHCSLFVRGDKIFVRDADSHTGTFLDGQQIDEAEISEGTHLLRVGHALVCIEPVDRVGRPVEPVVIESSDLLEAPAFLARKLQEKKKDISPANWILKAVEGPATGYEHAIGTTGGVVGREGSIKVPDEYLSRKHFEIYFDEAGALRIRDLGSRNGTFLNTLPAKSTKVHLGDEIRAGMTVFRIEQP